MCVWKLNKGESRQRVPKQCTPAPYPCPLTCPPSPYLFTPTCPPDPYPCPPTCPASPYPSTWPDSHPGTLALQLWRGLLQSITVCLSASVSQNVSANLEEAGIGIGLWGPVLISSSRETASGIERHMAAPDAVLNFPFFLKIVEL